MRALNRLFELLAVPLRHGIQTNHDLRHTVLLAGCGRSGTTWVSEILNADKRYHVLFEPFNTRKTPAWSTFKYRQYLARDEEHPAAYRAAESILTGRVHTPWIDSQNRTLVASGRLVKETRANLMLGWMREQFSDMPIVILTRHPLAVTRSREKLGWGPGMSLENIKSQPALIRDHLQPFMAALSDISNDDFAMQIANWCIEHFVPFRQLRKSEYLLLRYEALVARPQRELSRLFQYLDCELTDKHRDRLKRASATASGATRSSLDANRLLRPWDGSISQSQIEMTKDVISLFGLSDFVDQLSGEDSAEV